MIEGCADEHSHDNGTLLLKLIEGQGLASDDQHRCHDHTNNSTIATILHRPAQTKNPAGTINNSSKMHGVATRRNSTVRVRVAV